MHILIANDDGYLQAPVLAAPGRCLRRPRRPDRRHGSRAERERHRTGLTLNRPLPGLRPRGEHVSASASSMARHPDCVHAWPSPGLLPRRPRSGAVGHQQRRQHGCEPRQALYSGISGGRDGRLPVRRAGDRVFSQGPRSGWVRDLTTQAVRPPASIVEQVLVPAARTDGPWLLNVNIPNRAQTPQSRPLASITRCSGRAPRERADGPPGRTRAASRSSTGLGRPAMRARPARAPTSMPRQMAERLDYAAASRPDRPPRAAPGSASRAPRRGLAR